MNNMEQYREMLQYVRQTLQNNGGEMSTNSGQSFRKRSDHCCRVFAWCRELAQREQLPLHRQNVLLTAALFHDIGYHHNGLSHESLGCALFETYAQSHGIKPFFSQSVSELIANHSEKERLTLPETGLELTLLMEADLLDEEGAMGIMTDCLTLGQRYTVDCTPEKVLTYLQEHSGTILLINPMVTPYAKQCWREKQVLVTSFVESLRQDAFLANDLISCQMPE